MAVMSLSSRVKSFQRGRAYPPPRYEGTLTPDIAVFGITPALESFPGPLVAVKFW